MTGLQLYTLLHVAISLAGIGTGLVVLAGMLGGKRLDGWTAWFLATTAATSVTGFFFPFHGFTPAIGTGIVSMMVLALASHARYAGRLAGPWRTTFVVTAVTALYLNVFVLVVQLFLKVPTLRTLAPQQNEPPFSATQVAVLALFLVLGGRAVRGFRRADGGAVRVPGAA
jgi:hypothetical protein